MAPSVRETQPWRDPSAQPFIRIDRVTKRFGDQVAVNEVSLDIYRGELFSLLGGSGCGKTTLLRMLAGFITPDSGSITIDGVDILPLPPYERPVNMMFQSYALFPHMSVENNIAFGLKRDGGRGGGDQAPGRRCAGAGADGGIRQAQADPAFRRPAPARGTGPRHRQAAQGLIAG
ncbi:MAG: ATP-binding cassette domain-containing protein [Aliidongia sp.]